jgi:hypothetical protein
MGFYVRSIFSRKERRGTPRVSFFNSNCALYLAFFA